MINRYILRAKWTRASRRGKPPAVKPAIAPRRDDLPLTAAQYLVTHLHLSRCWKDQLIREHEWFVAAMRGELPPHRLLRNFVVHHVNLPYKQYLMALEALTTRLGVKLSDEKH